MRLSREQIKKRILIIGLLGFLIVSFFFITPAIQKKQLGFRSSQLKQDTTIVGNMTSTTFVDNNGEIATAADVGYATKIVIKTKDGEFEEYLDDEGKRVCRHSGYYGIYREYDQVGNNVRLTYVNLDNNPIIITQGYAIEEREYDDEKRIVSVSYYDEKEKPVLTSFGYGKSYEYNDDGQIIRITYLDENGKPMIIKAGYASVVLNYYTTEDQNIGKTESEFYLNEWGEPIKLSLGQYGVHKE